MAKALAGGWHALTGRGTHPGDPAQGECQHNGTQRLAGGWMVGCPVRTQDGGQAQHGISAAAIRAWRG